MKKHWHPLILLPIIVLALPGCNTQPRKEIVKIAAIVPLTGPNSSIGVGMRNASQLAIDQANARPKSQDIRFEFLALDDASKPDVGINAVLRVSEDPNILAVNGHYNTPVALASLDTYHEYSLPVMIYGIGTKITLEKSYPEIFRIPLYDLIQMRFLAKFVTDELKHRSVFLLDDGTAYGKPLAEALRNNFQESGVDVKGSESYNVGDLDFTTLLTKVRAASPEALIVASVFKEASLVRRQMKQVGLNIPMIGVSGIFTDSFIESAGEAANGVRAPWVVAPLSELPGGEQFAKDYAAAGFREPYEAEGLPAYSGMQVILEAIRRAGKQRQEIVQEIRNGEFQTAMGPIAFDKNGDNKYGMLVFYQVQDGRWMATHEIRADGSIVPYESPVPYKE